MDPHEAAALGFQPRRQGMGTSASRGSRLAQDAQALLWEHLDAPLTIADLSAATITAVANSVQRPENIVHSLAAAGV